MAQSIESLLDEYLTYQLSMERFVRATADAVRSDFRGLARFMKEKGVEPTIEAFTTRVVADYLATNRRRISGATLKRWYKSFNGFGRWAENNDYIQFNPIARIDLGFVTTNRREFAFACIEGARRFLEVPAQTYLIPEVDRLLRSLLLFAGLRRNEVMKLCWSCVDWEQRELRIYDSKNTRRKNLPDMLDRIIPICPLLLDALAAAYRVAQPKPDDPVVWRKLGHRLSKEAFYTAFRSIARAAGMPDDAVPHSLRHNLASALMGLGATAADIALLLGHRNGSGERPSTTDGYIHSSLVRVRSFIDAYSRLVSGEDPVFADQTISPAHPVSAQMVAVSNLSRGAAAGASPDCWLTAPAAPPAERAQSEAGDSQHARRIAEAAELWVSLVPGGSLTDPEFLRFLRAVSGQSALGRSTGSRM